MRGQRPARRRAARAPAAARTTASSASSVSARVGTGVAPPCDGALAIDNNIAERTLKKAERDCTGKFRLFNRALRY